MKPKIIVLLVLGIFVLNAHTQDDDENDDSDDVDSSKPREEEGVLVLTNDNFDAAIAENPTILVEFYAPWCGHCKSLAPEYVNAAKVLKENDPPLPLAKVDATVEKELAERFEIGGYPTIKLFKDGEPSEYDGARTSGGIVEFMKQRGDPNYKPPPEAVVTVTQDNFDEFVASADLVLLEFYAPWCGHCKRLAPEYEKAAKRLNQIDEVVPLGKVDATIEKDLAEKYHVSGYPTLMMFRKGRKQDYVGPRDASGIINYMMKQQGEASKLRSNVKDLRRSLDPEYITVVGFFDNINDPQLRIYMDAANDMREDNGFLHTVDKESRDFFKINPRSVALFIPERFQSPYENKFKVLQKDEFTVDDIRKFVEANRLPLAGEYTRETEKFYKDIRPLCLFLYQVDWSFDHREATQVWRKKIAKVANNNKDITFAIADEDDQNRLVKEFNLEESGEDINMGCFSKDGRKYKMDDMDEWEEDHIEDFLKKFRAGKLKPQIKSQPKPKKQGAVTTVVGSTFDEIVLNPKKDVLLELYAPWCGHCKQLEPKYEKLAKRLKKEKNLVIAKMDATANDVPENFRVGGFPTIYLAKATDKENPVQFNREREVDDFVKFLKEEATVSFGKDAKDEL